MVLHILGLGGVGANSQGVNYYIGLWIESLACCAVDCFAIISGYVGCKCSDVLAHYKKFPRFWLQVFFYSFLITLIAFLAGRQVGMTELIKSALPVTFMRYWYVSAYVPLYFVMPWLNRLIQACSKKNLTRLVVVLFLLAVYSDFTYRFGDSFSFGAGYSFIWLAILYIVGAWIKVLDVPRKFKSIWSLLIIIGCVFVTWIWKITVPEILFPDLFMGYISPTIILISISLVCLFVEIDFNQNVSKIISYFSTASFAVYLIHLNPFVRARFMIGKFTWISGLNPILFVLAILAVAFGILIACLLIDKVRQMLFKTLKVDYVLDVLCELILRIKRRILSAANLKNL